MKTRVIGMLIGVLLAGSACAGEAVVVQMHLIDASGKGKRIGAVTASDSQYGLLLTPELRDLSPGVHGFHVHRNPKCGRKSPDGRLGAGLAAGGHYDPKSTKKHKGPYREGHLGDLPVLYVDKDGRATIPLLAPRLKVGDLADRSLMIHARGDNYSDKPAKLGGGGARVACGVVK
jgi:Cu-Zn family superoxide dismutase